MLYIYMYIYCIYIDVILYNKYFYKTRENQDHLYLPSFPICNLSLTLLNRYHSFSRSLTIDNVEKTQERREHSHMLTDKNSQILKQAGKIIVIKDKKSTFFKGLIQKILLCLTLQLNMGC